MTGPYADVASAAAWLRLHAFPQRPHPKPQIGAEVEFIVHGPHSHDVARYDAGRGPLGVFLDEHARRHGWCSTRSEKGAPRWVLAHGGAITLEPGGQIEYSTPPYADATSLLRDLASVVEPLILCARDAGLELLAVGIDPVNDIADVPLQLEIERYRAMDAYFAGIGGAGRRMMRQTAAVQLNLDAPHDPMLTWRVLNALTPCVLALTANSPTYVGAPTGWASYRAANWRLVDPSRTGVLGAERDAALEYARFAVGAGAMVEDPFGSGWTDHLSTLFPEVRPRGWFELRTADAVPPDRYASLILPVSAVIGDEQALHECAELLGQPSQERLERAARDALSDPVIHRLTTEFIEIATRASRRSSSHSMYEEQLTELHGTVRRTL